MPSAKVLKEKQKIVEELTGKLKSQAGVLVNYSGITVNEDTEMRVKMREANVDYTVVKNTLMRFAIKNVGFEELDPILNGTTSLAISNVDPVAPARIIKEYADRFADYFEIKGGFMDGKVLSVKDVNALASIPPLPILQARLLGTMLAPIASLAVVLKAIAEQGGDFVDVAPVVPDAEPEKAAEAPLEVVTEAPAGEAAPVEATVDAVAETPAEVAVEVVTEAPIEVVAETPLEETAPIEAPVKEPAKKPASTRTAKAKAEKPADDKAPVIVADKEPAEAAADPAPVEEAAGPAPKTPAKKPAAKKAPAKTEPKEPAE